MAFQLGGGPVSFENFREGIHRGGDDLELVRRAVGGR